MDAREEEDEPDPRHRRGAVTPQPDLPDLRGAFAGSGLPQDLAAERAAERRREDDPAHRPRAEPHIRGGPSPRQQGVTVPR